MKKIIIILTVALASIAGAQTSNVLSYVNLGSGPNTGTGDSLRTSFGKINGDLAALAHAIDTNAPSGGVSSSDVTNISTTVATNLIMISSNGVVGWVNAQNYITTLTTNIARTSRQIQLFTNNAFVFTGSNYVGRFSHVYRAVMNPPQWIDGNSLPHTYFESFWGSYSGTNGWFQLTNTTINAGIWTNITIVVLGTNSVGVGTVNIFGLDHPEVHGNVVSYDGQTYLVNGSPVASQADIQALVHTLSPPVQMSESWVLNAATTATNQVVTFQDHNNDIFKLVSSASGINQASGGVDGTGTNILLNTTNLVAGWFMEECTNLSPPVLWQTITNYTITTNSGVITFALPINFSLSCQFFRVRYGASVGAAFTVPVALPFAAFVTNTLTHSTNSTFGYGAGLLTCDTNYLYISVASNQWRRISIPTNGW